MKKEKKTIKKNELRCPICGEFPIDESIGADFEYCYKIGKCKNGHSFGMRWKCSKEERGKGRELVYLKRMRFLQQKWLKENL